MKKFVTILLITMMFLSLFSACSGSVDEPTKLGDTSFTLVIPKGYALTDDDMEKDQIAYYYKDDESIDFDVYAWDKEDYVLKEEAEYFANEYDSTPNAVSINGYDGYLYISVEEYDGYEWYVYNYMFEDDNYIVEICFWTNNSSEELAAVEEIINTLK